MKFDGDDIYTLSTGRTFYANNGILGIDPKLRIFDGYDGEFHQENNPRDDEADYPDVRWTQAERAEIAAEMVRRWTEWGKMRCKP